MTPVYVDHFCYALGEVEASVEETAARGAILSEAHALRDAGFERHFFCGPNSDSYDLARRALRSISPELSGIDAIVYATSLPLNGSCLHGDRFRETGDVKYLMDFPASRLQSDFGLAGAQVYGLNQQGCTGMLGSISLARMLLHAEPDCGRVLCLTADRFPQGAFYEQSYNLMSDGAAACIVTTEPADFRLVAADACTNGAFVQASDDEVVGQFFTNTVEVINRTVDKAGLSLDEVDWIVPQNTNVKAWQILSRLLAVDPARIACSSIGEVGHVIAADNIINLKRLIEAGQIGSGERVLLVMAGFGLNWQCSLLEKE